MSNNVNSVYIRDNSDNNFVEIQPEYVYMTIPAEYVCIYHKILTMLADFGIEMLKDCQASCNSKNKKIIDCFNMFNAAVAARKLNQDKLASTLIKYVKSQIDINYKDGSPCPEMIYPVDKEGKIKALVGCGTYPTFMVDVESGKLWENLTDDVKDVYALDDSDLSTDIGGSSTGE